MRSTGSAPTPNPDKKPTHIADKPGASVVVSVAADTDALERQLTILRVLCSQIGFALDTALLALAEARSADAD